MSKLLFALLGIILAVLLIYGFFYKSDGQDSFTIFPPSKNVTPTVSLINKPCMVTGCSGQVCSDKEIITTCEFRDEYVCYKNARCERQKDGKCGWTQTAELLNCIKKSKSSGADIP